jgi:hypothetical protein
MLNTKLVFASILIVVSLIGLGISLLMKKEKEDGTKNHTRNIVMLGAIGSLILSSMFAVWAWMTRAEQIVIPTSIEIPRGKLF